MLLEFHQDLWREKLWTTMERRLLILITRICMCGSLSAAAFPHYCTDPDVSWGNGKGPLVVHCWVVGNCVAVVIARMRNVI